MALIPVLALAGLFGERHERRSATAGPLRVVVNVPTRFRYGQRMALDAVITNSAGTPVHEVSVKFDSTYLDAFADVSSSPQLDGDDRVRLGTLAPQMAGRLSMRLQGESAGATHGVLVASDAEGDIVRIPLSSFVFP